MIKLIFINNFFNSYTPSLVMFVFFFFGLREEAIEVGLVSSLTLLITQIFSSNKRNIVLATNDKNLLYNTFIFRLFFGIILFLFIILILSKLNIRSNFGTIFVILFIFFWVNEIILTYYELEKNKKLFQLNLIFFVVYFFLLIFIIVSNKTFLIKNVTLIFFSSFILFVLLSNLILIKKSFLLFFFNRLKKSIKKNIFELSFLSSFSFLLSVFIWRYFIVDVFGKTEATLYFISFAIASFPGTFLNNQFGITFMKSNKAKLINLFYFIVLYYFISFLFIIIHEKYLILINRDSSFENQFEILYISLIGTIFMIFGIIFRLKILNIGQISRNLLFKSDFFYGLLIATIVPVFIYSDVLFLIKYSYLISSIMTLIFYFLLYKKIKS